MIFVAVFLAGLRHGFDLDHIAAITDISSSQLDRRRSVVLGTVYALGHAVVLFVLGALAVLAGRHIPEGFDTAMGRVIGLTLVALGIYVVYSMVRFRGDMRLQSRWMLILSAIKRTAAWLRRTPVREVEIEHAHEHAVDGHHHAGGRHEPPAASQQAGSPQTGVAVTARTHAHRHKHFVPAPTDPFTEYGIGTSLGIGMIHGVGAETPSQIVLFTTAAGVSGSLEGLLVLSAFVAGLLLGNTILVVGAAAGFAEGNRLPRIYLLLAGITALVSIIVGTAYALGRPEILPSFLGG